MKDDLIRRSSVLAKIKLAIKNEEALDLGFDEEQIGTLCGLDMAEEILSSAPAVDAVEVVRCKDCKYWQPHEQYGYDFDNDEYYDYCELQIPEDDYYAEPVSPNFYCGFGERKDENEDL